MKRLLSGFQLAIRPLAVVVIGALLFSACKKDDTDNVRTPVAGLMAFNLALDKSAVGFTLSGNNLTNASLAYNSFTGAYLPVYVGSREVRSVDYSTGSSIAISTSSFADSMYYSVFLLGNAGNYQNFVTNDRLDSLTAITGKAWVRYVNAIADSSAAPTITIGAGGENVINAAAPFASASPFTQVTAGTVTTAVSNGGSIAADRTITLEENKIYTVLFTGLPNQTDTTKAVQIKFIQNGTLAP